MELPDRLTKPNWSGEIVVCNSSNNASPNWLSEEIDVRVLDGRQAQSEQQLFSEMSSKLQFPNYFGNNWDALEECLGDLEISSEALALVIVVTHPGQVLINSASEAMSKLTRVLIATAQEYSSPVSQGESWDRPAIPFHVILCLSMRTSEEAELQRWRDSGAKIVRLNGQ